MLLLLSSGPLHERGSILGVGIVEGDNEEVLADARGGENSRGLLASRSSRQQPTNGWMEL